MFWLLMNEMQDEGGRVDLKEVYCQWKEWYNGIIADKQPIDPKKKE